MLRYWIRILHFPTLVASTFTFILGTAIADYLGHVLDGWSAILGGVTIWCMLSGSSILFEYLSRVSVGAAPFKAETDQENPSARTLLIVFIVLMTLAVAFGFGLSRSAPNAGLTILLLVGILLSSTLFLGQPRLVYSGYGELLQGVILCSLVPAFAFTLQSGVIPVLFLVVTFPLTFIFLAGSLAFELESYAGDLQNEHRSLLIRLSWQRGVGLHHILLLVGYILLACAPFFGVAWRLVWPALLALAVAMLEIWLVNRIALGYPPRWPLLRLTAWLAFILPSYLLAITFWMA
jgi:1,4-dihydroxy-2-naphthoate octaprenyltransferase